jgi:hypothetical protein
LGVTFGGRDCSTFLIAHSQHIEGMTVEQWFAVLNERVFFFLQRKRLDALLGAYKCEP